MRVASTSPSEAAFQSLLLLRRIGAVLAKMVTPQVLTHGSQHGGTHARARMRRSLLLGRLVVLLGIALVAQELGVHTVRLQET